MKPKLLIFIAWLFYLSTRRHADDVMTFCMVLALVLAVTAYFYCREHPGKRTAKKKEKAKGKDGKASAGAKA